jgi:hypothetical protein
MTACAAALALALMLLVAGASRAQQPSNVDQARVLFRAAAQAYQAGDYGAALQAFEAARALAPDPALTYAIGQAHRQQFLQMGQTDNLRGAVDAYQRYLREAPTGHRRRDAEKALSLLMPKLRDVATQEALAAVEVRKETRLLVISAVEGASVTIDGGRQEQLPFAAETEPGTHRVTVTAPGYQVFVRDVVVAAGAVVPVDAQLEPLPAALSIVGEDGAQVWVDGAVVGRTPLTAAAAVTPGRRFIAVTKSGRRPFFAELGLERGEQRRLDVELQPTSQRVLSIVALSVGAAGMVAGGVFGGLAIAADNRANDVLEQAESSNISREQQLGYLDDREARGDWTRAAAIAGATGGGVALVGALLFFFDEPKPPGQLAAPVTARPGPGGAALHIRF